MWIYESNHYHSGPVPKLFSNEPEKSMEMMRKSPELAFDCLQQLVGRLFERGDLTRYE